MDIYGKDQRTKKRRSAQKTGEYFEKEKGIRSSFGKNEGEPTKSLIVEDFFCVFEDYLEGAATRR